MKTKPLGILAATVLAVGLIAAFALPVVAADDLVLVSLVPPSGERVGITSSRLTPLGREDSIEATIDYVLESSPSGVIGVVAVGGPGSDTRPFVVRGRGRTTVRFGVFCGEGASPRPVVEVNSIRFFLLSEGRTLVEKVQSVSYRFRCGPDLTSTSITIGRETARFPPEGARLVLRAADAALRSVRGCVFNVSYDVRNIGVARTASAYRNRIYIDRTFADGTQVEGPTLNPGEARTMNTRITLTPGEHHAFLKIDDYNQVPESDELNNTLVFYVAVDDTCPGGRSLTPPSGAIPPVHPEKPALPRKPVLPQR